MKTTPSVFIVAVALSGCAGISSTVPKEIINVMTQKPYEAGRLPVGRVLSVEKIWFQRDRPPPNPAYISPQHAAIVSAAMPVFEAIRSADWFYRHTFRMRTGETVTSDLKYEFTVGECVAFRAGLQEDAALQDRAAIPALKGQCDGV